MLLSLVFILSYPVQNLAFHGFHAETLFSVEICLETSRLDTKLSLRTSVRTAKL